MEAEVQNWKRRWASRFGEEPTSPPVYLSEFESKVRSWRLLGVLTAVVEAYFAALFASSWSAMERWQAIILAESFAVLLAVIIAIVLNATFDDSLPEDSTHTVKKTAGVLAGIAGVLIGAFYLTRFFPIGEVLFPWLTGSVSIILPPVAGACFLLAHVYRDFNDPAHRYASLAAYKEDVSLVLEVVNEVLGLKAEAAVPEASEAVSDDAGEGLTASRRIITGVILLFALAHSASAQVTTVREWWDASGSLDPRQLEELRRGAWQAPLMRLDSIESVEIYTFATIQDTMGAPKATVKLTSSAVEDSCGEPTESERFLKIARDRREEECRRKQAAARYSRERDADARLRQVTAALGRLDLRGPAPQSCIYQIIARCLADPSSVASVIITDGNQEACPVPAGALKPLFGAAAGESRILVVLLPGKNDGNSTFQRMEERAREIKRRAPQVTVVPAYQAEQALRDIFNIP